MHEIAAGSINVGVHQVGYLAQSHWHHFRYRIGEMIGLDRERQEVEVAPVVDSEGQQVTPRRKFRYDTLVMAVGSQSNDFGTPGVNQHALKLGTTADARRFNRRLINACIRAHAQEGPVQHQQLQVAIIGAGATGVELAAELHRTLQDARTCTARFSQGRAGDAGANDLAAHRTPCQAALSAASAML